MLRGPLCGLFKKNPRSRKAQAGMTTRILFWFMLVLAAILVAKYLYKDEIRALFSGEEVMSHDDEFFDGNSSQPR